MDSTIRNETDLKETAEEYSVFFSNSNTNQDIQTHLLRRQILQMKLQQPLPIIPFQPTTNTLGLPEIQWEAMSCYVDAMLQIFLQKTPSMDRLLWTTLSHVPHSVPLVCDSNVEYVRETWR